MSSRNYGFGVGRRKQVVFLDRPDPKDGSFTFNLHESEDADAVCEAIADHVRMMQKHRHQLLLLNGADHIHCMVCGLERGPQNPSVDMTGPCPGRSRL